MALVPYDRPLSITGQIDLNYEIEYVNDFKRYILGTYATKERALEVLDEITESAQQNQITLYFYDKQGLSMTVPKKTVYEMPND